VLYLHLAKDIIAQAPMMTLLLSLDSHIFLRLITSFEPLFLMANFLVYCVCNRIHFVSSRPYAKDLALHEFGVAEWGFVVLSTSVLFSAVPLIGGVQDAFPDSVRSKAAVSIGVGFCLFFPMMAFVQNFGIYKDSSHTIFQGSPWFFSTNTLWNNTNCTLWLFQVKFLIAAIREPGCYVVWKASIRPGQNEEHHHSPLQLIEQEEDAANRLTPISFEILKCARDKIEVNPCMLQKQIVPALQYRTRQKLFQPDSGINCAQSFPWCVLMLTNMWMVLLVGILSLFQSNTTKVQDQDQAQDGGAGHGEEDVETGQLIIATKEDIEGCWCGCLPPYPFCTCTRKEAMGPDEYVESGCLPFPFPFTEERRRVGRTNDFRVVAEDPNNINRHCEGGWNWNCIWGFPFFSMRLGEAPDCVPSAIPDSEQPEPISVEEGVKLLRRVLDNLGRRSEDEAELIEKVRCHDEGGDHKLDEKEFWRLLSDEGLLSAEDRTTRVYDMSETLEVKQQCSSP